jgi:hypothetical protein
LSLLILGIFYFASRFVVRTEDKGPLWLLLITFSILAALLLETWRAFHNYSYPIQFYRLSGMLLFALLFGIFLICYLDGRFGLGKMRRYILVCLVLNGLAVFLPRGFDYKIIFAYQTFLAAGLILSIQARRKKFAGAGLAIAATAIMMALLIPGYSLFLDRYLYLGFAVLLVILFIFEVQTLNTLRWEKERADREIERLELELLKRHIQPHFLMNTLTSLAEWIEADPRIGGAMIESLAEEFRGLISLTHKRTITLGEEISLCRSHLKLMGFRNDRTFDLVLHDVSLDREVPPTLFHTLLENAFSHNRYPKPGVAFHLWEKQVDGGVWYEFEAPAGTNQVNHSDKEGTGTTYIKARLKEAYGSNWTLTSETTAEGGLRTHIAVLRSQAS